MFFAILGFLSLIDLPFFMSTNFYSILSLFRINSYVIFTSWFIFHFFFICIFILLSFWLLPFFYIEFSLSLSYKLLLFVLLTNSSRLFMLTFPPFSHFLNLTFFHILIQTFPSLLTLFSIQYPFTNTPFHPPHLHPLHPPFLPSSSRLYSLSAF